MNEAELGRLIAGVAPELPTPPDRLGAVRRRARRYRYITSACAAVAVGVVLIAGAAIMRPDGGPTDRGQPVGASASASAPAADGVLRTKGCASYPAAGPTEIDGTPVSGNSDIVNAQNNRVVPYATANFADVFAVTAVTDIGRLRVYRKPSAEFDAWILRDFNQDCVEVADAKASASEMAQWTREIADDSRYWTGRGVNLQAVSGDPVNGVIEVTVAKEGLARASQELPQRYPHLNVTVVSA